jgi:beta-N-acetylhexosaminidase
MKADSHFMLAFEGTTAPSEILDALGAGDVPGLTLFRHNVESATQVAELTTALQAASGTELPLLIAADQETGQLVGLGEDTTPFPGAMALGATGDPDLAERVAHAVGIEMRALGVTMNYAPVCDIASNPANPSLGIRSFSDDPDTVAVMAAATVRGLTTAGVVATAKHFPGKGEAMVDPHHELPVLDLDEERLTTVELLPFRRAIESGVPAVMVGHYAVPAVTGRRDLPTSISSAMIDGILRRDLGFDGVVITDALDMGALPQGIGQVVDVIAAVRAGVDLLLCTADREVQQRLRAGVDLAISRGLVDPSRSVARTRELRRRLTIDRPDFDLVGCREHRDLAAEVARRSITMVRDHAGLLPLDTAGGMLAVMPAPTDLTPADTSSRLTPGLGSALRSHHPAVEEIVTSPVPDASEIAAVAERAGRSAVAVVGTISAGPEQAELVRRVIATGTPTVTVALRTPFDLAAYPEAATHLCTYSIQPPAMAALADVLFGTASPLGRLPAAIPSLYGRGHHADR